MSNVSRRTVLGAFGLVPVTGLLAGCGSTDSSTAKASPSASSSAVYTKHTDLAYAATVGRGHLLDLYVPAGNGPFPVVIYIAGSAYRSDDTKGGQSTGGAGLPSGAGMPSGATTSGGADAGAPTGQLGGVTTAENLAKMWGPKGYAIVGLNVRGSGQAKFPAQVYDIKAAVRYLRANASKYHLDSERFAAMGTSSGGWTVLMGGLTNGVTVLEGNLGNNDQSSDIQAVIDLFGPTNFLTMDAHKLSTGLSHNPASSPESTLMGFAIQTNPAAVKRAAPVTYVTKNSPPIFISHGTSDPLVPYQQAEELFAAYERVGASATMTLVPKAGHTDSYLVSASDSAGRAVKKTGGGKTTSGTTPAPTYETLLQFLDDNLR